MNELLPTEPFLCISSQI